MITIYTEQLPYVGAFCLIMVALIGMALYIAVKQNGNH